MPQLYNTPPAVLYKFRSDIGRDVPLLLNERKLYLASQPALNDPFDCVPRMTVPPLGMRAALVDALVAGAPPGLERDARSRAELLLSSPAARERYWNEFWTEDLARGGVLSLTASRDDPRLWAHYAGNSCGFVVGYRGRDSNSLEALPAAPVKYTASRPEMSVFPGDEDWYSILHTKSDHWSYEAEWRYFRVPEEGGHGPMSVPPGSIVEVILGPRITPEHKRAVVDAARSLPDNPRLLQAHLRPDHYGVTFASLE